MDEKKILDVTCGSRTIWFNKEHPNAVFCDKREEHGTRIWKSGDGMSERKLDVNPDVVCDFTNLPFDDDTFSLVVFDPPHLQKVSETAWLYKKYGKLGEDWPKMLHDGFEECMRVLKPDGVLVFKWSDVSISTREILNVIGQEPLFGHRSGKK
jgi:SAM-dependent methyltransferase